MISRIRIKNFRSFKDIEIGPFNRVNLIAGLNNTGKTGLLEAIFLCLSVNNGRMQASNNKLEPRLLPNLFRVFSNSADANQNFWRWLIRDKDAENIATIELNEESPARQKGIVLATANGNRPLPMQIAGRQTNLGGITASLMAQGASVPFDTIGAIFSSHPSDPVQDAIDYNRVILKRAKKKAESLLRNIDPRLESVEALQTGTGSPLIYADIGLPEMIPVTHLGEGFCRLLAIYSEILAGEAKVLLIDEIENGLHHSVLPIVWKGLIAAANELDVQIFATTHSAECIFAADQAARESEPYELALIRLDRSDGDIKATVMDRNTLETARKFDWELR